MHIVVWKRKGKKYQLCLQDQPCSYKHDQSETEKKDQTSDPVGGLEKQTIWLEDCPSLIKSDAEIDLNVLYFFSCSYSLPILPKYTLPLLQPYVESPAVCKIRILKSLKEGFYVVEASILFGRSKYIRSFLFICIFFHIFSFT